MQPEAHLLMGYKLQRQQQICCLNIWKSVIQVYSKKIIFQTCLKAKVGKFMAVWLPLIPVGHQTAENAMFVIVLV